MNSSNLPIDTVQSFVETAGNNVRNWKALYGRKVIHLIRGQGQISMVAEVISEIWVDYSSTSNTLSTVTVRYPKEKFIHEFREISPPLSIDTIQQYIFKNNEYINNRSELVHTKNLKDNSTKKYKLEKNQELEEEHRLKLEERKEKKAQAQRRLKLLEERKKEELFQRALAEEEKNLKLEQERQKLIQFEIEKQTLLTQLKEKFQDSFLSSREFYKTRCSSHLSYDNFQIEKSNFVQAWIKENLTPKVDFEQATAIGTVEVHVQVIARAGSGKTSTLINRAIFLQQHCGAKADEILLLAFNRDAVEKIREDLTEQLSDNHIPHILTFHALAYALVHPEYNLLVDKLEGEQSKSRTVQDKVIDNFLRRFNLGKENHKTSYQEVNQEVQSFMMKYFREDWERIVTGGYEKSREEMLQYRRAFSKDTNHKKDIHDKYDSSLSRVGLDGRYYKSFGEKAIANFLFEHNISYKYEYSFWWDGLNYKPDFKIGDKEGVIIEYFGLVGKPKYNAMIERKRKYWECKPEWYLLELFPKDLKGGDLEEFYLFLKKHLEKQGVNCCRLSEEEIWQRSKRRAIDHFTKVVKSFIERCRKLCLTPDELSEKINNHFCDNNELEYHFLKLVQKFYKSYLDYP